jgi:hypothetical protein
MKRRWLPSLVLAALVVGAASPLPMPIAPPRAIVTIADNDRAADMDFLLRMGMAEGHLIVGHDLLLAKQAKLGLPHFGHPVHELYDDVSGYLDARKFPPFDRQLVRLEAAVAKAPYSAETEAQYQAAIKTIHKARELAPADLRASVPAMIKICADTLDAASGEFNAALEGGRVESIVEYHDSRGYVSWISQYLGTLSASHPDPAAQSLLARMKTILAKAQWIVEPLLPASAPRASVADYRAVAAEAARLSKP